MTIRYFAYGSNLHPERLGRRLGRSLLPECGAVLVGYSLRFHKRSFKDGSGKCNAFKTSDPFNVVHGAIYRLSRDEKSKLDICEGLGFGYNEADVAVRISMPGKGAGAYERAVAYVAAPSHIDTTLSAYDWYRGYVLSGAVYHGFPEGYIEQIKRVRTVCDPDRARGGVESDIVSRLLAGLKR